MSQRAFSADWHMCKIQQESHHFKLFVPLQTWSIIKRCLYVNAPNSIHHSSVEPVLYLKQHFILVTPHQHSEIPFFFLFCSVSLWFALVVNEHASSLLQAFTSWIEYLIRLFRLTGSTVTLLLSLLIYCCPFMLTSLSPKGR